MFDEPTAWTVRSGNAPGPRIDSIEFAQLIAGRTDFVREFVPSDGKYTREIPWPSMEPDFPYAIYLWNPRQMLVTLTLDIDAKRGPDAAAQADGQARQAFDLLTRCGKSPVLVGSGPRGEGGRHVHVPLEVPLAPDQAKDLAMRMKLVFPALDIAPLVNPRKGCIRPPGAPHKDGGRGRIFEEFHSQEEAGQRLEDRATQGAVNTLLKELPPCPDHGGRPRDLPPRGAGRRPRKPGRPLPEPLLRLVERGEADCEDQSRSGLIQSLACQAQNAGLTEDEAYDLLVMPSILVSLVQVVGSSHATKASSGGAPGIANSSGRLAKELVLPRSAGAMSPADRLKLPTVMSKWCHADAAVSWSSRSQARNRSASVSMSDQARRQWPFLPHSSESLSISV